MRFAAANVRELIFLKIAIEQKAVEYGLKGRIVVASSAFVYTNAYFALQNACWGHPQTLSLCTVPMQAAHSCGTLFTR